MKEKMQTEKREYRATRRHFCAISVLLILIGGIHALGYMPPFKVSFDAAMADDEPVGGVLPESKKPVLDTVEYDRRMLALANNPQPPALVTNPDGTVTTPPEPNYMWPVQNDVYPKAGALLPFNRIVSYYGNFYSTKMGVLGEYEPDVMLAKLKQEVKNWEAADPETPVIPAIHYIAIVAQGSAGADGKWRFRMPDEHIQKAIDLARQVNGVVFLDLQVALSDVRTELPLFEEYLKLPEVHLGLDPEFYMKTGAKPGSVIGTMDAADINYATGYLAEIVKQYDLPPKILVVHRFTQNMVTNYKQIVLRPEVQFVMDMDGWGFGAKKINTYNHIVADEPVQFTGFKLFYKNDLKSPSTRLLTPAEVLGLSPKPIYIQYQ